MTDVAPAAPLLNFGSSLELFQPVSTGMVFPNTQSFVSDYTVIPLANGNFAVATGYQSVKLRIFDSHGQPVTDTLTPVPEEVIVDGSSISFRSSYIVSMAELEDGRIAIAYRWAYPGPNSTTLDEIRVQIVGTDGQNIGAPIIVADASSTDQHPMIEANPDGGFTVVWYGEGYANTYTQSYDANGLPEGSVGTLDRLGTVAETLSDGSQIMVWLEWNGSGFAPVAQITGPDGLAGAVFAVGGPGAQPSPTYLWYPSVTATADGGYVVAWAANFSESGRDIMVRVFGPDGALGDPIKVNTSLSGDQVSPEVVTLKDGGFLVIWQDFSAPSGRAVVAQRFDPDGHKIGSEFVMNDELGIVGFTAQKTAAVLQDGTIVLVGREGTYLYRIEEQAEDTPFLANITAALSGAPANQSLTIVLSGFPAGTTFSLGQQGSNGTWIIPSAHGLNLSTLTVTPPANWSGVMSLTAQAIATDLTNGLSSTTAVKGRFTVAPVNDAPELTLAIPAKPTLVLESNGPTTLDFGPAFHDAEQGNALSYSARLSDGSPLPSWLEINAATGHLIVQPGVGNTSSITVVVTATDNSGESAQQSFTIKFAREITGGTGNDLLVGGDSHDQIAGLGGNDTLNGGRGDDTMIGGRGNDTMLGGAGNDTFVVDTSGDRVFETTTTASAIDAGGIDTVQSAVSFNLDATAGVRFVERLTLTGTANINGTGNKLANILTGNAGNNVLNGGLGNDTMTGGAGEDTFVFNKALGAGNIDRITDFAVPDDTIRLDGTIFAGLAKGKLAASAFAANLTGNATDRLDRIIFEKDTGRLYYDADGSGGGARVLFATLSANLAIKNTDFFVF